MSSVSAARAVVAGVAVTSVAGFNGAGVAAFRLASAVDGFAFFRVLVFMGSSV
jgi:hypothetical protein